MQVSPVTMSRPSPLPESCSTLFAAIYKSPTEGGRGGFCLGFFGLWLLLWEVGLLPFVLGFLVWKLLEGKRITKGKLLKGKEWLIGVDRTSALRTLT
jgi:hypothetical protein